MQKALAPDISTWPDASPQLIGSRCGDGRDAMTTQFTRAPIFDADQHMYETADSLTKHLPEKYSRTVQFVQIGRQMRIVINNKVNDFIPNPTFERVAAPGAHEKFFAGENTKGLTLREMQGPAIEAPAATRNPTDRIKSSTVRVWSRH